MSFVIYAWFGLLAYGLFMIIGKFTSKHSISNPWLFNFSWTFFTLIFTLPIALYYKVSLPNEWTFIIISSIFNSLWFIFFGIATYRLDVSVLSPLYNFRTVFALILSSIILGESFQQSQLIYIFFIIIGGIFTSIDESFNLKSFFNTSIFIGISGMFFLAVNNVLVNMVLANNGFWEGTLWMLIFSQIFMSVTVPLFAKDLKKTSVKQVYPLLLMGLLSVIGNICFNISYKENVSITSLIAAIPASMIMAFLFSVFAPQLLEKHTIKVYAIRFTAAAIMIVSALKLSAVF